MKALLFDLDDTLIPDTASIAAAMLTTCREAERRYGIDANNLAQAVLGHAEELWQAAPTAGYCDRLGIASWEGLTSDFSCFKPYDDDSDRTYLREWAPSYRREAFLLALQDFGLDEGLAGRELSERFREDRWASHVAADGAHELLEKLAAHGYELAVVTNGPEDLQGQKLVRTGLKRHFDTERTFISGALGLGKPSLDLFRLVLERIGVEPREAIMIGDNPDRDVLPALAAGLHAIWMRNGRDGGLVDGSVPCVDKLGDLPDAIRGIEADRA